MTMKTCYGAHRFDCKCPSQIKMISIPIEEYKSLESRTAELEESRNHYEGLCHIKEAELNKVRIQRDEMEAQNKKMREALKRCVDWMEPVMDGFKVPEIQKDGKFSARVEVLGFAKSCLDEIRGSK